jgi:predicted 3-demethylubiquinone-9 3-methyltransferase (glyoxalase superfamily)
MARLRCGAGAPEILDVIRYGPGECASDAEIERLYASLSSGGQTPMPLGSHGFSAKFAWVIDRYGISWQLSLSEV